MAVHIPVDQVLGAQDTVLTTTNSRTLFDDDNIFVVYVVNDNSANNTYSDILNMARNNVSQFGSSVLDDGELMRAWLNGIDITTISAQSAVKGDVIIIQKSDFNPAAPPENIDTSTPPSDASFFDVIQANEIYTRQANELFVQDVALLAGDTTRRLDTGEDGVFDGTQWVWELNTGIENTPTQLPVFGSNTEATNFYLAYWHGSQAGNGSLPLQVGLRYQGTDGRERRSVPAATAEESWIDANQWSNLLGLTEGFREELTSLLTADADGISAIDGVPINASRLNGQTAQQIIDAARTRQRVHSVDLVINPNTDAIPDTAGTSWATLQAGNSLTGMTLYRRTAAGANSVIDNLIPGDYVLVANGDLPDIAYITKTDPDTGSIVLVPVGEDELTAPELQLVQALTTFGGNRITDLLIALEEFGTENLHNAQQINNLINAKVDPLAASLQALIDFGDQRAVDLLTLLEDFGPQNLIKIGDVDTRISQFYAARNLMINFHPAKGSPLQGHANYDMPLQAPFSDMSVYAVPDGQASGYHFRNVGVGVDTSWIRVG